MANNTKPLTPYKSISSTCKDGTLIIEIEAFNIEDSIRFAYGLHVNLLPLKHEIVVSQDVNDLAIFRVVVPSHGK